MRILITGASGLLGINLALEAVRAMPESLIFGVVNQRKLDARAFEEKGIRLIQADLLSTGALERVLDQVQPNWIINCAALAIVDECEADPNRAEQLNSGLPARLAKLVSNHVARGGARLLHVSTDAVFDGALGQYSEQDEANPLSVYAKTKLDGERHVFYECTNALVTRVNMVGWSLSRKRSLAEFFYNNLSKGTRVNGFTDVIFCPLLANHLARLLLEMLERDLSGLYHVVSSECISKYDYALRLAERFGFDPALVTPASVSVSALRAARGTNISLSTQKLAQKLGRTLPGIQEGIDGLYQLYLENYPQELSSLNA